MHNQYKADKTAWETEKSTLAKQIGDLQKKIDAKADAGKDVEQLRTELESLRSSETTLKEKLTGIETSTKSLVERMSEGLTEDQKKLVAFADPDPVKRLEFINTLKGTKPPVKTSQGGVVVEEPPADIDVEGILKAQSSGNAKPYQEAIKKHGKEKVQKALKDRTNLSVINMNRPATTG